LEKFLFQQWDYWYIHLLQHIFLSSFGDYVFRMAAKEMNETATITLQIGDSNVAFSQVFLNKQ
jgi:hypothetical protein